ncbi:pyridoxamine 5'-phosphate oxidase family protein [Nocardiopsis sp. MG754419]|uniref:pyridoxamine 5'-phosphate oxidase family protein n=1 Tax=Nocardiopsis sp. MG754419 TaxID=2259865 RepID=UPI001BA4C13E|nr:pyridoxamine 5'-phosphate oxidase family protein [Nocardiopsis sp. MG754419]MBR8743311.1 hypothetical protein [Nocardiopsis sp. MG754419]
MNVTVPVTDLCPEFGSPGADPVPWERARALLADAPLYRVTTVRPDGRPHMTPLLGVWAENAVCFCTGPRERKARNLAVDPRCLMSVGDDRLDGAPEIVVEGTGVPVEDPDALDRIAQAYEDKYGPAVTEPTGTWFGLAGAVRGAELLVVRVVPIRAFAFGKAPVFSQTRYTF